MSFVLCSTFPSLTDSTPPLPLLLFFVLLLFLVWLRRYPLTLPLCLLSFLLARTVSAQPRLLPFVQLYPLVVHNHSGSPAISQLITRCEASAHEDHGTHDQ